MKAVVLFSGGLDSSVCLGLAVRQYGAPEVLALSVAYGQRHLKELDAARKIAQFYGVQQMSLDLGEVFKNSRCSLLEQSNQSIPQGDYAQQLLNAPGAPVSTYVPYRNGLFLSSAASIALSFDCNEIYYGAHADDAAGNAYPDTSTAFHEAISRAIFLGSGSQLRVNAPFIDKSKAQVVAIGRRIGVPFALTWSCYQGHTKACGVCGTCIDRQKAFRANDLTDPIEYEVPIHE